MAHRVAGTDVDYCLALLPGLAVVEALYRDSGAGDTAGRWQAALERVDADRDRALSGGATVFGETTVLVCGETPEDALRTVAAGVLGGGALTGAINPQLAGGGAPLLLALTGRKPGGRGYYCLAAAAPEEMLSQALPDADAQLKKLDRVATYFGYQRKTIENERSGIDEEVGALLHRQVVADQEAAEAVALEERIARLSRMFGMLATDSLMVRQAAQRLERDLGQLRQAFAVLFVSGGGGNEIADHYEKLFSGDVAAAAAESRNLAFSRQNTQAAIEVVRTQVELLRAGEEAVIQEQTRELLSRSLLLQKERMALQVATGFVEFVLVFYYVLKSWEGIAGAETVEHIAPLWRLVSVGGIAAGAAVGTHFLAQALQRRSARITGLWLAAALLIVSLAALAILTVSAS